MLDGGGAILDVAREVSGVLVSTGIPGMVIGGVAVVLHGHLRTTKDVDVYLGEPPERFARELEARGYRIDRERKELVKGGIPVHLVMEDQVGTPPAKSEDIEGVRVVSLADLISMKLRSGTANLLRAQDLADVIGLIRHRRLTSKFAGRIQKDLRPEFRKLVKAIRDEMSGGGGHHDGGTVVRGFD